MKKPYYARGRHVYRTDNSALIWTQEDEGIEGVSAEDLAEAYAEVLNDRETRADGKPKP